MYVCMYVCMYVHTYIHTYYIYAVVHTRTTMVYAFTDIYIKQSHFLNIIRCCMQQKHNKFVLHNIKHMTNDFYE